MATKAAAAKAAGGPVKAALEPEAWHYMIPWILEIARDEEHAVWLR